MESIKIDHLQVIPLQERNLVSMEHCCNFFNIHFLYNHATRNFGRPTVTESNQHSIQVPCHLLVQSAEFHLIHDLLPDMDIPCEILDAVLTQLVSTARDMLAANSQRSPRGVMLTLGVKLSVTSTRIDVSRSFDFLEKLGVDDVSCSEAKRCIICLNDFSDTDDVDDDVDMSEVVRTACSHLYHKGCISQWLNKNQSCPMCHHQLI